MANLVIENCEENLWVAVNWKSPAELAEAICVDGKVAITLTMLSQTDRGYVVSNHGTMELILKDLQMQRDIWRRDDALSVSLCGYLYDIMVDGVECDSITVEDIECDTVRLLYDPVKKIAILESMRTSEEAEGYPLAEETYDWPSSYTKTNEEKCERAQFMKLLEGLTKT